MPKRSNAFQKLVLLINNCIFNYRKVHESVLLIDKAINQEREVDIFISDLHGKAPINISIEVVDKTRKADIGWVEQMYAKHLYLPTDQLILVSRRGFTKSALDKARFWRIEALTFEEALTTNWELAAQMPTSGFFERITVNYQCSALCSHFSNQIIFSPVSLSTTIFFPDRKAPTNFENIVKFVLDEPTFKDIIHKQVYTTNERSFAITYNPEHGTYVLDEQQNKLSLLGLVIELNVDFKRIPVNYSIGRYRKNEIISGESSDPKVCLHFALVKEPEDGIKGSLYDDEEIFLLGVPQKN